MDNPQAEQEQLTPETPPLPSDVWQRLKQRQATPADWAEILQHGVYLERREIFLPWGASLCDLEKIGASGISKDPGDFVWEDEPVLGGLKLKVSTGLVQSPRGLRVVNCTLHDYKVYGEFHLELEPEWLHLRRVLGEPNWGDVTWRFGSTELTLDYYSPNEFHSDAGYHKYIRIEWRKLTMTEDYQRWREMIFAVKPEQVGASANEADRVYGVIMDIGMVDFQHAAHWAISLSAFPTGEASFRPTPGGGVNGLENDPQMAHVGPEIVEIAQTLWRETIPTENFTLPEPGFVQFFFLTTGGVRGFKRYLGDMQKLENPFSQLLNRFGSIRDFADRILDQRSAMREDKETKG